MSTILNQRYKIIEEIVKGRFTIIHKGKDLKENKDIAIKEFHEAITDKTFNIYIDLVKKLKGNNSINALDYFKENGKYYMIMELCDCNLYEFVSQYENGLSLSLIQKILLQLNVALKNIRFKYFVDKYINPGDILIKYKDSSKTDFDIKLTGYLTGIIYKDKFKFESNILCFRAPEIDGDKVDIWSLGITMYFMYYKEFNIEKIKKKKLFSMNKQLNNTNFRNLLSKSLEIKEKKRMTWIEYFNQPFFKEEIKDDYEPPNESEENYREPEERDSQHEQKLGTDLNIEPLKLNEEEKEIIKEIDEKQEELIKENAKKNLNPDEKNNDRKNLIINMIEVGTMYADKINLIKKNNPNYFLNIDEIIKDENHVYFPISILAKSLEKNGILTAVEHNDNVSEDELLRNIQYIGNGLCNLSKFEIDFDFEEERNKELLEDLNAQSTFNEEIINNISNLIETPIEDIILCNPRKGSYKIDAFFSNNYGDYKGLVEKLNQISIPCKALHAQEKPLVEGMILNTRMFDIKGNRNDGWGQNETRGKFPYYPPIGWTGYGIRVEGKYDGGNDVWLDYNDSNEGVWSVVYHGTSLQYVKSIMEHGLKKGKRQAFESDDDENENHPNQKVGIGVYTTPKIEISEDYAKYAGDIEGYICAFMCRANPKLARICNNGEYWVVDGTNKDLRPYRLLIKKV